MCFYNIQKHVSACVWNHVQARLQAKLSSFEPRPFQPYDQNPRICLQTKQAIQRWARAAPPPCPALRWPSLRSTSSLGSCTPHKGPHCECWGNAIIVTIFPFRWKTRPTFWIPVTFWEVCGFLYVQHWSDIMRRNVGGSRTWGCGQSL